VLLATRGRRHAEAVTAPPLAPEPAAAGAPDPAAPAPREEGPRA
jgi:hypothetical protein